MDMENKVFEKKPCMRFKLTNKKPSLFESKVGGVCYIPHDGDVPKGGNGVKMQFLAQVDCADIDLEDFPKRGLLQFWILEDDLGLGWEKPNDDTTYRVIYYSEVDHTVTADEVESKLEPVDDEDYFPVKGEYGMVFEKVMDENYVYTDEEIEASFTDESIVLKENNGHKIGGFPYFTQEDPREYSEEYAEYSVLLFQLDSDYPDPDSDDDLDEYDYKVMWGDAGVGNFFIKPEKLKALDFSDILYNWDCC